MAKAEKAALPVDALVKYTKDSTKALEKIVGKISEIQSQADALTIGGIDDTKGYKAVDEKRKEVKGLRTAVERKRKELNEPTLTFQRELMAVAKKLTEAITPIEEGLEKKLRVIDDEKQRLAIALARRLSDRVNQLFSRGAVFNGTFYKYGNVVVEQVHVTGYTDEQWSEILAAIDAEIERNKPEELLFPVDPGTAPVEDQEKEKVVQEFFGSSIPSEQTAEIGPDVNAGARSFGSGAAMPTVKDTLENDPEFMTSVTEYKGLLVDVYRKTGFDASNNGVSAQASRLILVGPGIPAIQVETNPNRVVELKMVPNGLTRAVPAAGNDPVMIHSEYPIAVPVVIPEGKVKQFGGNFIFSADIRFPSKQPIAIHDRVE